MLDGHPVNFGCCHTAVSPAHQEAPAARPVPESQLNITIQILQTVSSKVENISLHCQCARKF